MEWTLLVAMLLSPPNQEVHSHHISDVRPIEIYMKPQDCRVEAKRIADEMREDRKNGKKVGNWEIGCLTFKAPNTI